MYICPTTKLIFSCLNCSNRSSSSTSGGLKRRKFNQMVSSGRLNASQRASAIDRMTDVCIWRLEMNDLFDFLVEKRHQLFSWLETFCFDTSLILTCDYYQVLIRTNAASGELELTFRCIPSRIEEGVYVPDTRASPASASIVEVLEHTPSVRDTSQHIPSQGLP